MKKLWLMALLAALSANVSCGSRKKSDRDARREQIRNNAELKRKELAQVAGLYHGTLNREGAAGQSVSLNLEVKDIPTDEGGEVDAVLVPTLMGFVRVNFGLVGNNETDEYIGFSLSESEYDPSTGAVNIVAGNETYKTIVLSLKKTETGLAGSWNATGISASGDVDFIRASSSGGNAQLTDFPPTDLNGEYMGVFNWGGDIHQFGVLTLKSTFQPPDSFVVSASLRQFFGPAGSREFLTQTFDKVEFNPISGAISFLGTNATVILTGVAGRSKIAGTWTSQNPGVKGTFTATKSVYPKAPADSATITSFSGKYRSEIETVHPDVNLPSRALLTFVVSPTGVSGNLRFYLGEFGSDEYQQVAFSKVDFDPFTRQFTAETADEYKLTLRGDLKQDRVVATIENSLGHIGNIEAERE